MPMVVCSVCGAATLEDCPSCPSCGSPLLAAKQTFATGAAATRPLGGMGAPLLGSAAPDPDPQLQADREPGSPPRSPAPGGDGSPPTTSSASLSLRQGQLVAGRYRVDSRIGFGSMGTVWRGTDERLEGRPCAIKTIDLTRLGAHEAAEAKAMFDREISVLSKLSHPGICEIRDVVMEGDARCLIMELVDGHTLAERLKVNGGRAFPEATVLTWAAMLVDALSYLHHLDPPIIFRDVKPQNAILRPDGRVTLVDFGIARPTVVAGGTAIGTGGYAPPEQYQGLADARSDEYALAATLHHLLTGRDPTLFTPFVFPRARSVVPSISEHVDLALDRALNMASTSRFPTVAEFGQALQGRLSVHALTAAPTAAGAGAFGSYPWQPSGAAASRARSGGEVVPSGPAALSILSASALESGSGEFDVYCGACNHRNTATATYCNSCGLRLGVTPAGFWIRTGAYVIDSIVLWIAQKIMGLVLGGLIGLDAGGFSFIVSCAVSLAYFAVFWTRTGRTPGMQALGLTVRDCSGDLMTWSQAIGRYPHALRQLPVHLSRRDLGCLAERQAWLA